MLCKCKLFKCHIKKDSSEILKCHTEIGNLLKLISFRSFADSDHLQIQIIHWFKAFIFGSQLSTDPGRWSTGWIVSWSSSLHWRSRVCGSGDRCLCFQVIRLIRRKVSWLSPVVLGTSHRPTQKQSKRSHHPRKTFSPVMKQKIRSWIVTMQCNATHN